MTFQKKDAISTLGNWELAIFLGWASKGDWNIVYLYTPQKRGSGCCIYIYMIMIGGNHPNVQNLSSKYD